MQRVGPSPIMSWNALILIALGGVLCFVYLLHVFRGKGTRPLNVGKKGMLPPGPPGLPIIGHLLMLGELPHHDLHKLAKEYGPIMYLRLALVPTIVVSSPQAAQQFLKTHDLTFASRPTVEVAKYLSYDSKSLSFSKYGSYWRNMRKLCTLELLSSQKIDHFKSMRREELGLLVGSIKDMAHDHVAVNLTTNVASLTANLICRMVFGRKYIDEEFHEKGFKPMMDEAMKLGGIFNIADYVPYIGLFDLQGLRRRMKATAKVFDNFLKKIVDEHERTRDPNHKRDFIDIMLSFMESNDSELQIDQTNIKAIALEMLGAGMDTSAVTVEWALAVLLKHPRVMKKAQEELENVVGLDRMVEESDLEKLEYLDMVVKESMRLHPAGPLLLPHESTEDCIVNGFHIPKKSRIVVNVWAIGRDPEAWPNAEEFNPDRFAGTNIDLNGHDFQLIPFGSGRRGCPGMQLGLTVVRLILAQLVHCFDWELPKGMGPDDLEMSEKFGVVVSPANHLLAIPSYRLHK